MLSRKQNSFSASSPSRPNFSSTLIAQQRLRLTSTKLRNETRNTVEIRSSNRCHGPTSTPSFEPPSVPSAQPRSSPELRETGDASWGSKGRPAWPIRPHRVGSLSLAEVALFQRQSQ